MMAQQACEFDTIGDVEVYEVCLELEGASAPNDRLANTRLKHRQIAAHGASICFIRAYERIGRVS